MATPQFTATDVRDALHPTRFTTYLRPALQLPAAAHKRRRRRRLPGAQLLAFSAMLGAAEFMPQLLPGGVLVLYKPGRALALQSGQERQPLATLLKLRQGLQPGASLGALLFAVCC